jgi:hypothetical protein
LNFFNLIIYMIHVLRLLLLYIHPVAIIFVLSSCAHNRVLQKIPEFHDLIPEISTGFYTVHQIENGATKRERGSELLGEIVYLYKDDFFEHGVYFSGITLAVLGEVGRARLLQALIETRRRGGRVVFDNNYRPRLWPRVEAARTAYHAVLAEVDIALLTEDDERALFGYGDAEQVFAAYPAIAEVVLKRGADACLIRCNGERFSVPALKVDKVVDTTAAGDSFSAAYLASRLQGGSPEAAALAGHRLASRVIQVPGALIPQG